MGAYYAVVRSDAYLKHYGVKGQKWGERRYQNPDGSYTAAGQGRYDNGKIGKKLNQYAGILNKAADSVQNKGVVNRFIKRGAIRNAEFVQHLADRSKSVHDAKGFLGKASALVGSERKRVIANSRQRKENRLAEASATGLGKRYHIKAAARATMDRDRIVDIKNSRSLGELASNYMGRKNFTRNAGISAEANKRMADTAITTFGRNKHLNRAENAQKMADYTNKTTHTKGVLNRIKRDAGASLVSLKSDAGVKYSSLGKVAVEKILPGANKGADLVANVNTLTEQGVINKGRFKNYGR